MAKGFVQCSVVLKGMTLTPYRYNKKSCCLRFVFGDPTVYRGMVDGGSAACLMAQKIVLPSWSVVSVPVTLAAVLFISVDRTLTDTST